MGATSYGAGSAAPSVAAARRTDTLALVYQQILTATVRIRANRQVVSDAQGFRTNINSALRAAEKEAISKGYSKEAAQLANVAVVAFLDESVLNSTNPVFSDWSRIPLQQELFGHNVAGEAFFENIDSLQSRIDSPEIADILEVYCLCLLLGFRGRFSLAGGETVRPLVETMMARIRRIRGPRSGLSPSWSAPDRAAASVRRDPWSRRLMLAMVVCLVVGLVLFAAFKFALTGSVSDLRIVSALIPLVGN